MYNDSIQNQSFRQVKDTYTLIYLLVSQDIDARVVTEKKVISHMKFNLIYNKIQILCNKIQRGPIAIVFKFCIKKKSHKCPIIYKSRLEHPLKLSKTSGIHFLSSLILN